MRDCRETEQGLWCNFSVTAVVNGCLDALSTLLRLFDLAPL